MRSPNGKREVTQNYVLASNDKSNVRNKKCLLFKRKPNSNCLYYSLNIIKAVYSKKNVQNDLMHKISTMVFNPSFHHIKYFF